MVTLSHALKASLLSVLLAGCAAQAPQPATNLDSEEQAGQALFTRHCAVCHSLNPDTIIVGPSLATIGVEAGDRVATLDAEAYLHQSILQPGAYLVQDFADLMPPTLAQILNAEEIDALVAYMLTLR